jgi:hypothetical protein
MTTTRIVDRGGGTRDEARRRKWIGLAFLAPPAAAVALFAVAETVGLEPGWWGHVLQLAAVALLAGGAWMRPRIGGPLLILAGTAFTGFVVLQSRPTFNLAGLAIVAVPLIASGVFFTLAGRATRQVPSQR